MAEEDQITFKKSKKMDAAVLVVVAFFFAGCVFLILTRPGVDGWNSMSQGGVVEFASIFGATFFGIYAVYMLLQLLRTGAVVSISSKGIFDRRVSTDWVPWSAIRNVSVLNQNWQNGLIFRIDKNKITSLPLRDYQKSIARNNASGAPDEFWIEADSLKGGFGALHAAVNRFHRVVGSW
ncbi:STM3941 family protein [Methylobacterium nodulans]|uniref:STM3941 family protein n=1 Tax=Methylobacterium nodulans TaxID=114616 RepID=UPI0012EDA768|nr:STM3941 family protein [Methylobacterium nodulans]